MRTLLQIRFCRPLATVLSLACFSILPAHAQMVIQPSQVRNQLNQTQAAPAPSTGSMSTPPANASTPVPNQAHKPKGTRRAAQKAAAATGPAAGGAAAVPASLPTTGRRDPFAPLLAAEHGGNNHPENLPPGKAGLMVDTLRIDGIIQDPNGMIAIVENPQQRVYFLREGDKLYDGSVTHIVLDAVSFHQTGTDAFGKPVDRELTKRLYPSSTGDSQ